MTPRTIVVLEGDQTGQELLEESLRVLHPDVTRVPVEFARYDLSLANRRATRNGIVHEAARAMAASGLGRERRDGDEWAEELDAAHERHRKVRYEPQLIDATLALLLTTTGEPLVIPTLNRDGDVLSDLVLQMFGSIAGAESLVLGFDDSGTRVRVVMAEAPHGAAPALRGKNVANPMAMILAAGALLSYVGAPEADRASRAIYESAFEAVFDGVRTADLGAHATATEFTDEVIRRLTSKLEVWSTLA